MSEKGDSQRVAEWPIVEYQSLVLTSFLRLSIVDVVKSGLQLFVRTSAH